MPALVRRNAPLRLHQTGLDWDIRLYPSVPRGTAEYKRIYKDRTSCGRVNDRVPNDYHLHDMGIHISVATG